jgi:ribosomal protein S12 methylthiotransferase accessory factor
MNLKSSLKTYTYGQDKTIPPEQTISKATSKLTRAKMPILERIFRIDKLDRIGIPAFICKSNEVIGRKLGLTDTFGKGVTAKQAKASALMEVIERYSCLSFLRKKNSFLIAPYSQIEDKACVLSHLISSFDREAYKDDQTIVNDLAEIPMCWTKSFSLTRKKEVFHPIRWFSYIYGTTGFAAGNSLEEAILQGICEVVERHTISSVIKTNLSTPSIALDSIKNRIARRLISKFHEAGTTLFIKDFSLGLEIPTVEVLVYDRDAPVEKIRIYNAAGTHSDRNKALIRALIEVAQHRCQMLYRKLVEKKEAGPTYCFPSFKRLDDARLLTDEIKMVTFSSIPSYFHRDFKKEIERTVGSLAEKNLEVIVTNVTHPSLKVPAVIVSIPGSRLNRPSTRMSPYFIMARCCMGIGRYQEAINCFEKAFASNPLERNNPRMLCRLGLCYKKSGDYRAAARLFQNAIDLDPKLIFSSKLVRDFSGVLRKLGGNFLKKQQVPPKT